jgi:hypothetical protein
MDNREIYTKQIQAGSRTYFFDIKKTERGDLYFNITETGKLHRVMIAIGLWYLMKTYIIL